MKIEQDAGFKPITITLESADEVSLLMHLVKRGAEASAHIPALEFAKKIKSWFCNRGYN